MKNIFPGILFALIFISGCKDEPTPFTPPANEMYFHGKIESHEKSIVENQNGYKYSMQDSCRILPNGISFYATASLYQGPTGYFMLNKETFTFKLHNIFDTLLTNRDSLIYAYFKTMPFAYVDSAIGPQQYYFGVEIQWTDGFGDTYTTLFTPQNTSVNYQIFTLQTGQNGKTFFIECTFECKLYSLKRKKYLQLTEGKARLKFNTTCF